MIETWSRTRTSSYLPTGGVVDAAVFAQLERDRPRMWEEERGEAQGGKRQRQQEAVPADALQKIGAGRVIESARATASISLGPPRMGAVRRERDNCRYASSSSNVGGHRYWFPRARREQTDVHAVAAQGGVADQVFSAWPRSVPNWERPTPKPSPRPR